MSEVAIRVEGLGKKYELWQQSRQRSSYRTLRDTLSSSTRDLFKRNGRREKVRDFWALKDVGFEIQAGEAVAIIGRNGAGKSTLLKILSRITEPTTGKIQIKGRVASLLEVGTGFHPELTGRENIFLNGAILGMSRREIKEKFDEIVSFAEVEEFLDTPVKRYSSGMYVRLAFAVAAHLEPEILIVDEVLAVGDAQFQKKCLGKMQDVGRSGRTVLFVSHNMDAVLRMCSQAILLSAGGVIAHGDVKHVTNLYSRSSTDSASRPLDQIPRHHFLRQAATFTNASIVDADSMPTNSAPFGGAFGVSTVIRTQRLIRGAQIGISIFTPSGTELISTLSTMYMDYQTLVPGETRYSIFFDSPKLLPGLYMISLGLRSEVGMEDHLLEALQLEILPTAESGEMMADSLEGYLIADARCEITQTSIASNPSVSENVSNL